MKCRFTVVAAAVAVLGLACTSRAYEYHLNGTLSTGKQATTIGEQFNADGTVSGQAYYYFQSCNRVCGPRYWYCGSGTWDAQGNLLTTNLVGDGSYASTSNKDYAYFNGTTACPIDGTVQYLGSSKTPFAYTNNEQVYAASGSSTTGRDTRGFGYLDTPASHYSWASPYPYPCSECNGGYSVIPFTPPTTFQMPVTSDGDLPLNVTGTVASVVVSGSYTQGTGTATHVPQPGDCLSGPVAPGTGCSIQMSFDPSTIKCTASPYGYAYNVMYLALASDAGNLLPDWKTTFTVTGSPNCGGE